MRKPFLIANWKMHKTLGEAESFCRDFLPRVKDGGRVDIAICPPFTCLFHVKSFLASSPVKLGAQNMFWEEKGAYTGEVSPVMLVDAGCELVIIGHSERRIILGETDAMINCKVKAALQYGLLPVLCVGETLKERQEKKAKEVVRKQLQEALEGVEKTENLVIAYEPVWAIGSGLNASPEDAEEIASFIRGLLADWWDREISSRLRILYGGSVKPENISLFMQKENIDGALVGGASLDPYSFAEIVRLSVYA
nr:triose-phosphate isomerase [Thermosyntropha lipolytica]